MNEAVMSAMNPFRLSRYFSQWFNVRLRYLAMRLINRQCRSMYLAFRPDFDRYFGEVPDSKGLHRSWTEGVELNNEGDLTRLYSLFLNLKACLRRCPAGAMAELGVYKGNSAKILHKLAPDRKFYLFDTFTGFSEDDTRNDPTLPPQGVFTDTNLSSVKSFVNGNENVTYCPGYFPATAEQISLSETFAFVHIDCDLYAPTASALEFFYPKLVPGGLIVVHDYTNGFWPGVARAVDEFLRDKQEVPLLLPDKSGTAMIAKAGRREK